MSAAESNLKTVERWRAGGYSESEIRVLRAALDYIDWPYHKATKEVCAAILAIFYTMPRPWRDDPEKVYGQFRLALCALGVMPRSEVGELIARDPVLADRVSQGVTGSSLSPWDDVQGIAQLIADMLTRRRNHGK